MLDENYGEAYDLAVLVAKRSPGHALVQEVQQELDRLTDVYVEQAIQYAQDGDDNQVTSVLRKARALPGRNPDYFSAVSESIANIREARIAAEQTRLERTRLAAVQARTAWVEKVQSAIQAGRLIAPAGDSARDYLAEENAPANEKEQLTIELIDALTAECAARLDAGNLIGAEELLAATTEIAGETSRVSTLRNSLENAFIAAESNRVLTLDDFVRIETSPARYPRRAQDRGVEGWVEVLFTVTPSGETTDIEIQQAEPVDVFDETALEAVEKWTFEPRRYRGRTISQRAGARLVFRLQ
jgi:TonB family protein